MSDQMNCVVACIEPVSSLGPWEMGPTSPEGRPTGPLPARAIAAEILVRPGVPMVESSTSGETDPA